MKNHLNRICEFRRIQCTKCKQIMIRKQMEQRQNQCPETKIHCDYCNVGCKVLIKRKEIDVHYANFLPFHLGLIRKQNTDLNKDVQQLQQRNHDLERKNANLQITLNQYQIRMNDMELRMNVMSQTMNR
eukprot:UN04107